MLKVFICESGLKNIRLYPLISFKNNINSIYLILLRNTRVFCLIERTLEFTTCISKVVYFWMSINCRQLGHKTPHNNSYTNKVSQ